MQPAMPASSNASNYPPQQTAGTIGSEWHESTPWKETTRPVGTGPQSTKNQPIASE